MFQTLTGTAPEGRDRLEYTWPLWSESGRTICKRHTQVLRHRSSMDERRVPKTIPSMRDRARDLVQVQRMNIQNSHG